MKSKRGEIYAGFVMPGAQGAFGMGPGMGGNPVFPQGGTFNNPTLLGPGIYSLGTRSTVPYVRLKGTAGFSKIASWGELIEVPEGEQATVENASHHPGDIFLNQGEEPGAMPSRITIGCPMQRNDELPPDDPNRVDYPLGRTAAYWVDARRARRVWYVTNALAADPGGSIIGRQGQNVDVRTGAYQQPPSNLATVFFQNNRYDEQVTWAFLLRYFALGWGCMANVTDSSLTQSMALFEKVRPYIVNEADWAEGAFPRDGLYVVEYY